MRGFSCAERSSGSVYKTIVVSRRLIPNQINDADHKGAQDKCGEDEAECNHSSIVAVPCIRAERL
jgi:hypothetical protein